MKRSRGRGAIIPPAALLIALVALSLAIRQGIAERNRPELPPHRAVGDIVKKVDDHFESLWRKANVSPVPQADDLLIARRVSLALVGSVPSMQDIRWLESKPSK